MRKIVIAVYKNGESDPETKITIPLHLFNMAKKLIPKETWSEMEKEGIDLNCFFGDGENGECVGTIIEIEKKDIKIIISVE